MLILVKHGAPYLAAGTPPSHWTLAAEGREQAERIAGRLMRFSPTAVVSSLEAKAVETAAVLAGAFGVAAERDAGLGEQQNDTGPFTDAAAFQAAVEQMFLRPREVVMGEESADEAHARFSGALDRQVAAHPSQTLVVVTHGRVMSLWASQRFGFAPMPFWRGLKLGAALVVASDADWELIEP
ncbi:histidine phosphatase family protein [Phenylobacterium sp.]|uniref:histidine phosphatase family protein n=1 Tax=Phenylobacterium sp. TaxID=1871053 RepID=UPI0025E6984F|nr:histidine phosphatase family protein [Phenylobacterium sp.]